MAQTSFTFYKYNIPPLLLRLGKPEALTAAAIVTKEHWKKFVPFDKTTRVHKDTPCRKEALLFFRLGLTLLELDGVEDFQEDYAFTDWASSASRFKNPYLLAHPG